MGKTRIFALRPVRRISIYFLLAALGYPSSGSPQALPVGGELAVNSLSQEDQTAPAVAVQADGRFLVVWSSEVSLGSDVDSTSIQGRIYDGEGQPLGGEFQVNTYTTGAQYGPAVAAVPNGFVVAWSSQGSVGADTDSNSIQARRFASDGSPLGDQFQVNAYTTANQNDPELAASGSGGFVVVWASNGSEGSDSDGRSVQARLFDSLGAPSTTEIQVNSYTTGNQWGPTVASDSEGRFVVSWQSDGSFGSDTSYESIQTRLFDASGAALGDELQVNDYTTAWQLLPSASRAPTGEFVVVWYSIGSYGSDVIGYSIQAQRFDASGARLGDPFQVNSLTWNEQMLPRVAMEADGGFVVTWASYESGGNDNDPLSIQARRFAADGTPLGVEFQVNTSTWDQQIFPDVATGPDGSFVVTWEDGRRVIPPPPTFTFDVRAQIFRGAFFYDGFESGDASRWSASVP